MNEFNQFDSVHSNVSPPPPMFSKPSNSTVLVTDLPDEPPIHTPDSAPAPAKPRPAAPAGPFTLEEDQFDVTIAGRNDFKEVEEIKSEQLSPNPKEWSVGQVIMELGNRSSSLTPRDLLPLRSHQVTGEALLELNINLLVDKINMKVGPAVIVFKIITELKSISEAMDIMMES